jgi:hypothetical protein
MSLFSQVFFQNRKDRFAKRRLASIAVAISAIASIQTEATAGVW